ncbi:nucleoside hydrolase [Streptomyces sp.]|uniref:nucleoside hydrolase n=1 Tax=Streptomyces sp. TaxID=1931 RepID=UPI002F3F9E65
MPKNILLVDCDTGVDDALALLYLLADPDVDIRGITTVFGNTTSATAAKNTLRVLELAGRTDIPVAVGASATLLGHQVATSSHVHGDDGLGGTGLPEPVTAPTTEPAAQLMVRLARENPGELHILATAPLTNLATALLLEPGLPALVKHVTVMGGAIGVPGNVTPVAEANVYHDPEAARAVLAAGWPVTLVPLDVTMDELLTEELAGELARHGGRTTSFAASVLRHYLDFYERNVFGVRAAACHDPLAAAIAVGDVVPVLAPVVPVDVETGHGPARGMVVADLRGRYRGYPARPDAAVRVVLETPRTFARQLVDRLCRG